MSDLLCRDCIMALIFDVLERTQRARGVTPNFIGNDIIAVMDALEPHLRTTSPRACTAGDPP